MCPSCEAKKAGRRAHRISKRLEQEYEMSDGDMKIGVLTWTLPGKAHPIRRASLQAQYDYATERVRFPAEPGDHSMRGLNRRMRQLGARGGTHFVEFTWNSSQNWWNLHGHTLFWAWEELDHLNATSTTVVDGRTVADLEFEDDSDLLGSKMNRGKRTRLLGNLGFGQRYTLDYADTHELELMVRYSAKVAYATKPFKAPLSKNTEIREFLEADVQPRLARPWGEATVPFGNVDFSQTPHETTLEWLAQHGRHVGR